MSTEARTARRGPRRTQAERRAGTRAALLDATIELLQEEGYARLTVRAVVARAGVSRGAQVHHYPTKGALVAAAVGRLAERRGAWLSERAGDLGSRPERTGAALDLLMDQHRGALFDAAAELWNAARTDDDVRAALVPVERALRQRATALAVELFGPPAHRDGFGDDLDTALAVMRGLAVLPAASHDVDRLWRAARPRLALLLEGGGRQVR